ncbi:MAG: twin-arginine translocase subunit TatC [Chloroflexi bacterium]|nr:twin-arginine translocase subunit TatC [Chloroflexota bacterium]
MEDDARDRRLTVIQHLEELRHRIVVCVIALVVTTAFSLVLTNRIFDILLVPTPEGFKPIYTEMTEMLTTYFKVAILSGVALALPVLVYEFTLFIAPALTGAEKRYFYWLLPAVFFSFACGLAFGYFLVLPFAVNYLLTFSSIATPFIKVGSYISFVSTMLFWLGLSFETPLLVFFLAKIHVVTAKKLASYRKFAIVGVFVAAAIITPTPDPINQAIVAIPLILLYEIGILLARLA